MDDARNDKLATFPSSVSSKSFLLVKRLANSLLPGAAAAAVDQITAADVVVVFAILLAVVTVVTVVVVVVGSVFLRCGAVIPSSPAKLLRGSRTAAIHSAQSSQRSPCLAGLSLSLSLAAAPLSHRTHRGGEDRRHFAILPSFLARPDGRQNHR